MRRYAHRPKLEATDLWSVTFVNNDLCVVGLLNKEARTEIQWYVFQPHDTHNLGSGPPTFRTAGGGRISPYFYTSC